MSTPAAQQPAAPKKHRPAPRSPPPARLTPPALPLDRGTPRAELRAVLPAEPPLQSVFFTTPASASPLKLPPNLQRGRRRQKLDPRRALLFPES